MCSWISYRAPSSMRGTFQMGLSHFKAKAGGTRYSPLHQCLRRSLTISFVSLCFSQDFQQENSRNLSFGEQNILGE